jgi:monooxygenase
MNEHFDVLIIGAGISGIGAGCHLRRELPELSYAILEGREDLGGTWDLFRYPGIRADSDMHTLGYRFKPWTDPEAIADGPAIMEYLRETAAEYGVDQHIRYRHRVTRVEWSSADALWTVHAERTDTGEAITLTCGFLFGCCGYFDYDQGHLPEFEGLDRYEGAFVHPQHWPQGLDYEGKRVVVIGSGATAVTLVPALAERAAEVTMLQRSPTYILALPREDPIANALKRWLPRRAAYALTRWKNVLLQAAFYQLSRRWPELVKRAIRRGVRRQLPVGYDLDTHFKPPYNPWDQRVCLVPDGDLFTALRSGRARIVTDRIERFTERGLALESGAELEADLVVAATGLNLVALGGLEYVVDGRRIELPETMTYRGMMLRGVPNYAFAIGYTNASWTLKVDITCEYVCRLLAHMRDHGYRQATPLNVAPTVREEPILTLDAGYVQRSVHLFPKQGSELPWRLHMNYLLDVRTIRFGAIEDGAIEFSSPVAAAADDEVAVTA